VTLAEVMGGRTKKAWPGCNPRGFSTPVAPGNEKAVALGSALDLINNSQGKCNIQLALKLCY